MIKNCEYKLISPKKLSESFCVTEDTLANWRSREVGPNYVKLEGRVMYLIDDVNSFIEENRVEIKGDIL